MRLGFVCAWIVLSACHSSENGAYVTVKMGSGTEPVTSVQLYIGQQACKDPAAGSGSNTMCTGIYPQLAASATGKLDAPLGAQMGPEGQGAYFEVDGGVLSADVSGGQAAFHLEAGSDDSGSDDSGGDDSGSGSGSSYQLIAVGFGSNGANSVAHVYNLQIPAKSPVDVDMTLVKAAQTTVDSELAPVAPTYVDAWQNMALGSQCVLDEEFDSNGNASRTFIVPPDNPDCDDWEWLVNGSHATSQECRPLWFDWAGTTAPDDQASCATNPTGTEPCLLGGPSCVDGDGSNDPQCKPTDTMTCLPNSNCDLTEPACQNPGTQTPFGYCSRTTIVSCTLYTTSTGVACPNPANMTSQLVAGTLDLSSLFPANSTTMPVGVWISDRTTLVASPSAPDTPYLEVGGSQLTIGPASAGTRGLFTMTWMTPNVSVMNATDVDQVIGVALSNGKQMMLPLQISVHADCATVNNAIVCSASSAAGSDSITDCAL